MAVLVAMILLGALGLGLLSWGLGHPLFSC